MSEEIYRIIQQDPDPAVAVKPYVEGLRVESHGSSLFGCLFHPAFYDQESRGPIVLMLHGHPGGTRNMDLAEHFRNNGFTVIVFSYRGIWGSHGDYCLSHNIEDTIVLIQYIREHAEEWRVDPDRLFLFGHSMGGFAALNALAAGAKAKGIMLVAPCDMGYNYLYDRPAFDSLMQCKSRGCFTLPTEDYMEKDAEKHGENWPFLTLLPKLDKSIPYRFIGGKTDGVTPPEKHTLPLVRAMNETGYDVLYTELPDGHTFQCTRVRLAVETLRYLREMDV